MLEDVNKTRELPGKTKEELPKQGTREDFNKTRELPDETKEELQKQGTALEDANRTGSLLTRPKRSS